MIARQLIPAIILLALLGLSHGLAYWFGQSAERQDQQLAAVTRERDDNAAINDLQQQLRRAETAAASRLLTAETRYQKGLADVQAQKDRILAAHTAGTARLSVPVKAASCTATSPAANLAGDGADPAPRAELSDTAVGFLVGLAAEADAVAVELNRCAARVEVNERLLIKEEGS